jgi:adenylyl- and sulfurtransferase ThiI
MSMDDDRYPDAAECLVAVLLTDLQFEPFSDSRQERWIRTVRDAMARELATLTTSLASLERERDAGEQNYQFLAATLKEQIARAKAAERERDDYRTAFNAASRAAGIERDARMAIQAAQPHPMLVQALSNLQALEAEMRQFIVACRKYVSDHSCSTHDAGAHNGAATTAQCWVDKLGTVIADLQEVKP